MSSRRALTVIGLLAPIVALIVIGLVLRDESSRPANANAVVDFDLDFSISSSTGGQNCDSNDTSTNTCVFPVNTRFTMSFNLSTLPPGLQTVGWSAYNMLLGVQGVTVIQDSLDLNSADVWPGCAFTATDFTVPNRMQAGCSQGIGAGAEFYAGPLMRVDFQCGPADSVGSLTLIPQDPVLGGNTVLSGADLVEHVLAASESLTIICGNRPTPTPSPTRTPGGATETPTPSPTITPTPAVTNTPLNTRTAAVTPTRTPRPNHVLLGDVDGDLTVNSLDALWVLWFAAGIVVDVPLPDAADIDEDNLVNATDALYILWVEAGEVTIL